MYYFDIEQILYLHYRIIEDFGGSHGVKDVGRLESVVSAARQEIFGEELYKSEYEKAAVYLRGIVADHPFVDGNKRTAITVAGIFLSKNKIELIASPGELEDFAVRVAVDHLDIPAIAQWFVVHSQK